MGQVKKKTAQTRHRSELLYPECITVPKIKVGHINAVTGKQKWNKGYLLTLFLSENSDIFVSLLGRFLHNVCKHWRQMTVTVKAANVNKV